MRQSGFVPYLICKKPPKYSFKQSYIHPPQKNLSKGNGDQTIECKSFQLYQYIYILVHLSLRYIFKVKCWFVKSGYYIIIDIYIFKLSDSAFPCSFYLDVWGHFLQQELTSMLHTIWGEQQPRQADSQVLILFPDSNVRLQFNTFYCWCPFKQESGLP